MFAVRYGHYDIVKLFVEAGALSDGKNPLQAA
jgi:ankyrin repeat protein